MTLEQAKDDLPNFDMLLSLMCDGCSSEDYCPSYCSTLEKAKKIPFEKLQIKYQKVDGDLVKLWNYIKRAVV